MDFKPSITPFFCLSDGRLHEGDQILAVNGKMFESSVTQEQAVQVLQEGASVVTLIIAREPTPSFSPPQMSHTLPKNLSGLYRQFSVSLLKNLCFYIYYISYIFPYILNIMCKMALRDLKCVPEVSNILEMPHILPHILYCNVV